MCAISTFSLIHLSYMSRTNLIQCHFTPLSVSLVTDYLCGAFCHQVFVLLMTIVRELYDDLKRFFRDQEVNRQKYYKLTSKGTILIKYVLLRLVSCNVYYIIIIDL